MPRLTVPGRSRVALALGGLVTSVVLVAGAAPGGQRRATARVPIEPAASPAAMTAARVEAFVDADRRGLGYLPGEVLVKFKAGTTTEGRERALSALRGRPAATRLRWRGGVARLTDPSEPNAHVLADRLARQPEVEYAHPNYIRRLPGQASPSYAPRRTGANPLGVPNDPSYRDLQWNFALLGMPAVWDINPGANPSIIVAIVDTGVTTEVASLIRALWVGQAFETVTLPFDISPDLSPFRTVLPRDFTFEPGERVLDFDGHGTHVASTIAEDANNEESLAGMAYNVRFMPVKVCVGFWELMIERAAAGVPGYLPESVGGCPTEDIAAGIRYAADNGARIINLSLGGEDPAPAEREAIVYAISRGAFVATSAGNAYEVGNTLDYPAAYAPAIDGLMSVAAVGKSQTRAHYSSTGSHIEIAAPGGSSRDGGGEDEGFVWQVTLLPPDQDVFETPQPRFDRYVEVGYSGTSMAAAHVSAMAALLMSQGVTNPRAIEAVIKSTALDLGSPGRDNEFGYGLIQPRAALFGMGIR